MLQEVFESSSASGLSFEYSQDPDYDGPVYPSLPMHCKRGISYTPPGWIRHYNKKQESPDLSKPINIDCLFE